MKIAILNTTILTADGKFSLRTISLEEVKEMITGQEILSAIGHQSTADILTELLDMPIPMNRIQFRQEPGQKAICFKLKGRPEEGKVLSREEIEAIGYEFKLLDMKLSSNKEGRAVVDEGSFSRITAEAVASVFDDMSGVDNIIE